MIIIITIVLALLLSCTNALQKMDERILLYQLNALNPFKTGRIKEREIGDQSGNIL